MERVLLINPQRNLRNPKTQFLSPPIGLAYLASFLRDNKMVVEIVDAVIEGWKTYIHIGDGIYRCGLTLHQLHNRIRTFNPDYVGISLMFAPRKQNVKEIATLVKGIKPEIVTIVGGMHATIDAQDLFTHPEIDYVIMGEAEVPMLNLINTIRTGKTPTPELHAVSMRVNGKIEINKGRVLIDNLDQVPMPAYDLLSMEEYFKHTKRDALTTEKRHASVITSRGCPHQCTFCSSQVLWANRWRPRNPFVILTELEWLKDHYHVDEISFEDDNISLQPPRLEMLCRKMIDTNLQVKWNTPNGIAVEGLNKRLIQIMHQSGCQRLNFGIESGDPAILQRSIQKNIDLKQVRDVVGWARQEGIVTLGYFVIGMPDETPTTLRNTINFAKSLELNEIGVFVATPFPGTKLYDICNERKLFRKDITQIMAEDDIESEVYFDTDKLRVEELLDFKRKFIKEFYEHRIRKDPAYYVRRVLREPSIIRRALCRG